MFVLMVRILSCLQRACALGFGLPRPTAPAQRANGAPIRVAYSQQNPLAPVPAPSPGLIS